MSTETKDIQMFFIRQLMGLKATIFCQNKQRRRCYAMPGIRVSLFMQQRYKSNGCVRCSFFGSSDSAMVRVTIRLRRDFCLRSSARWSRTGRVVIV